MQNQLDDKTYEMLAEILVNDPRFERFVCGNLNAEAFIKHKFLGNAWQELSRALDGKIAETQSSEKLKLLDVGGGDGNNLAEFLNDRGELFDCYNLDIEPNGNEKAIIFDITKPIADNLRETFDVIYSFNAFEHFCDPLTAADNVVKLLKPAGLCLVHTVFSWRYHPVPYDYYRYTDDALEYLFSKRNHLEKINCGYDVGRRRENIKGGYFEDKDIPPIDNLGGFRENWSVFYSGKK